MFHYLIRMFFNDLCLKIYFWPFLSYLANIKGFCPFYPGYYPIIPLPPGVIITPSPTVVPTFQPTPPLPCPPVPLVCLPNGQRPIPYCPCIDPRLPNGQIPQVPPAPALPPGVNGQFPPGQIPQGQPGQIPPPPGSVPNGSNGLGAPPQSAVERVPNLQQSGRQPFLQQGEFEGSPELLQSARISQQPGTSEMMVFTSLSQSTINGHRHRRRKPAQTCVDSRLRAGQCVSLDTCPQLVEDFYTETRSQATGVDFQTYVSDMICGFDGRNFLICCSSTRSSTRFVQATSRPQNTDLSLGSLFQFAPLTALSGGNPVIFTTTSPQQTPIAFPTNTPNQGTPPVIFQPTTPNVTPTMVLPPPGVPLSTSQTISPTPPSVLISPTPPAPPPIALNPIPTSGPPIVLGPTPPAAPMPTLSVSTNCGVTRGTTNRVVGGAEARRGSYPWLVALGYYEETDRNTLKFLCAGSLISPKYVLTSAHCINPTLAVVRLGAHDLSRPLEPNAIDLQIKRNIIHESFDIRSIANDIALLELSAPAPMSDSIGLICLPEGSNFLSQDFVGMHPFVAGWGAVKHQGPTSNVLRDAQVPIVNRQTCEQNYKTVFRFIEFSDKLICAGSSNADACQGDSGGPLMLPLQTNENVYRYFLVGMVSYGYECARSGFPGVYTRVASYMPWIRAHLTS